MTDYWLDFKYKSNNIGYNDHWYGYLDKYSIRTKKASMKNQINAITNVIIDIFLIKPIILYYIFPFISNVYIQFNSVIPSVSVCFIHWLFMKLIFSTSLYFLHKAMHYKSIYQYIHKKHHSHHETVAFSAQYAHPIESLISSLHVIIAIVIVKPHFIVFCFFMITTMVEIIDSHCGYDVPWSWLYPWSDHYFWGSGARAHDYHHSHNLGIYGGGLTGLWDKIFETDKDYLLFKEKSNENLTKFS